MAQEQWYMAIGGHQVGPVSQEDVITNLRNGTIDGNTLVFSAGMANWTPLKDEASLAAYLKTPGSKAAAAAVPNLVAPDNVLALSDAITAAVNDPFVMRDRAKALRERVQEHFSQTAMVDGVLNAYADAFAEQ